MTYLGPLLPNSFRPNLTPATKPVTQSVTAWGGFAGIIVSIITALAANGIIPSDLAQPLADLVLPTLGVIAGVVVLYGRIRARHLVTLTGTPK